MGEIHNITPAGIVRNTPDRSSKDGALHEAVNVRYKDGAWRGVGDKVALAKYLCSLTPLSHVYVHPVLPADTYLAYNDTLGTIVRVTGVTGGYSTQTTLLTLSGETFTGFAHINNILAVFTDLNRYLFYYKDAAYHDISTIPLPVLQVGDQSNTAQTIYTGIFSSPTIPDYDFGTRNYAEYMRLAIAGENEKNRFQQVEDGYTRGYVQVRAAFKMFDGNYILHSAPLVHFAGYNSEKPELDIAINSTDYSAFYTNISMAKVYLYYSFTEAQALLLQELYDMGVITSLDIFVSRPVDPFDLNAPIDKWAASGTDEYTPPETDGLKSVYDESRLYRIESLKLSDILQKATSGTYTGDYEAINGSVHLEFPDDLTTNDALPVDSFTHHSLLPDSTYLYNSRLHLCGVTQKLSEPLNGGFNQTMPLKLLNGAVFNGWGYQNVIESKYLSDFLTAYHATLPLTTSGLIIYQQAWLDTEGGRRTTTSELAKTANYYEDESQGAISADIVDDHSYSLALGQQPYDNAFDFDIELVDTLNALNTGSHTFTAQTSDTFTIGGIITTAIVYGYAHFQIFKNGTLAFTQQVYDGLNVLTGALALTAGDVLTFNVQTLSEATSSFEETDVTVYANSWFQLTLGTTTSATGYTSYTDGTHTALILNPVISYPDYRAKKLRYFYTYGGTRYHLADFTLTECVEGNYAYYAPSFSTDKLLPCNIVTLPVALGSGTAMPSDDITTDSNTLEEPNRLQVSEQNNPLYYASKHSYRIGNPETAITAAAALVDAVSEGQFGDFPLYVFTSDGIFTLSQGTGTVLYANIIPLNNEVLTSDRSYCITPYGIVFATAHGMKVIAGRTVKELSAAAEGLATNPLISNPYFISALSEAHLPQMLNNLASTDFLTYIQDCTIGYDKENDEIIISRLNPAGWSPLDSYSYTYNFSTGTWATRTGTIAGTVVIGGTLYGVKRTLVRVGNISNPTCDSTLVTADTTLITADAT